jgi:hypothetical protein
MLRVGPDVERSWGKRHGESFCNSGIVKTCALELIQQKTGDFSHGIREHIELEPTSSFFYKKDQTSGNGSVLTEWPQC